jgi:predicted acylesterase/phospholipase RssA
MRETPIVIPAPRRIGGKFLGGFVPAVSFHYGVLEVLEERGFVLRRGFRAPGEPRATGPPGIDLVAGSSAGAFFVIAACAGADRGDLVGLVEDEEVRFAPFQASYLGQGPGLTRKVLTWLRGGPRAKWGGRRTLKAWAGESTVNMLFPLWSLEPIERYLARDILAGRDWEDLRTEAAILAVDMDHPVTYVLGERESPVLELLRSQPVDPEVVHRVLGSEGWKIVEAFAAAGVPRDHPVLAELAQEPERRHATVYVRGVSMANAAAGSMATYPFYAPMPLRDAGGAPFRVGHHPVLVVDGEDRNPFTTDVAEDAGCDLIFVSSINAPYKYLHGMGSVAARGYSAIHQQKTAQSRDAKQEAVMRAHAIDHRLYGDVMRILEGNGTEPATLERVHEAFQRRARIDHRRIRIYPDPDIAAENRIARTLDPLAFTPDAVARAVDLGRMVAKRVLSDYVFEFLDRG